MRRFGKREANAPAIAEGDIARRTRRIDVPAVRSRRRGDPLRRIAEAEDQQAAQRAP
jgi:hypothetical protein